MGLYRFRRYGPICFHKFFLLAMSNPIYLPAKVSCQHRCCSSETTVHCGNLGRPRLKVISRENERIRMINILLVKSPDFFMKKKSKAIIIFGSLAKRAKCYGGKYLFRLVCLKEWFLGRQKSRRGRTFSFFIQISNHLFTCTIAKPTDWAQNILTLLSH